MTKLAIRGHETRGKEVIELLEMLGGKNTFKIVNTYKYNYYRISGGDIYGEQMLTNPHSTKVFTLEEFYEKFPYKVGDKVKIYDGIHKDFVNTEITCMKWFDNEVLYATIPYFNLRVKDIQPYKEDTMEIDPTISRIGCYFVDKMELILHDTHEVIVENGRTYVVKKKPQYPKTYVECCEILGCKANDFYTDFSHDNHEVEISDYEDETNDLLQNFRMLKYCRDAYWKITGEQMGLDKPWKPDWVKADEKKYCIVNTEGNITKWVQKTTNKILAFPTEEMRDAFFKNFKILIELCKEFL